MLPLLLVLAVLIAALLVRGRAPLEHAGTSLPSKVVEFIEVGELTFRSTVTAYGTVEPSIMLEGRAEVAGKISYLHPDLKQGGSISADTVVARIDPADYEVSLRQTEADLAANEQSLLQLEEEEKTARRSLVLANRNLEYGRKELARIKEIFQRNLVSRSTFEAEQQRVIQYEQQVEELQGQINSFASRKDSVKAQIRRAEQQVKGQQTNLGRTEIRLPFNARIGEVYVEKGEFVSVGGTLFQALDVNGVEIDAQLPALHMSALLANVDPVALSPMNMLSVADLLRDLGLTATVRLVGGRSRATWEASVLRISEAVDPIRRTIGLVVGVDNPYGKIIVGSRPPLLKGMFTAVRIATPPRDALVVPRGAVHEGRVYLVDENQRLEIRELDIDFRQGDLVRVRGGLEPGDRLIVTDLYPVIEGMPLQPIAAPDAQERLRELALGEVVQ
jgi:multidrug efflux pump subunit AcrA (membrane-fusion protein)